MSFSYDIKKFEKPLHFFYEEGTFDHPNRLGGGGHAKPLNLFRNLALVRTFAVRYKLKSAYINHFEQE